MSGAGDQQLDLAARLLLMAENMVANPGATLSDGAIRELPALIKYARQSLLDDNDPHLIDAEAACLVELMTALSYARGSADVERASRMVKRINDFASDMRTDLERAQAVRART